MVAQELNDNQDGSPRPGWAREIELATAIEQDFRSLVDVLNYCLELLWEIEPPARAYLIAAQTAAERGLVRSQDMVAAIAAEKSN